MSGEVTLIQKQVQGVLYLANQAIIFEAGKSYVLKKGTNENGIKTEVSTGFSNGRYVEILSGLNNGDTVLAESAVSQK